VVSFICSDFEKELDFVNQLIDEDVRNNSAWSHRYFVISSQPITKEVIDSEIKYTWSMISKAYSNESPWSYLRG